jgi:hypothetical protein
MPKFAAQHLLADPLNTPELPPGDTNLPTTNYQLPTDLDFDPVQDLFSWQAPSRPHRVRNRAFYTTVASLVIICSLIAFVFQDWLLIGAILAFGFLVYVLNFIAPSDITYKFSTQGITIGDHFYHWDELDSFWFEKKGEDHLLYVLTRFRFPGVLILVLGEADQDKIKKAAAMYLPFREIPPKTQMDKWTDMLQKYFSFDAPNK